MRHWPISLPSAISTIGDFFDLDPRANPRIVDFLERKRIVATNPTDGTDQHAVGKEGFRAAAAIIDTLQMIGFNPAQDIAWSGYKGERGVIGETIFRLGDDNLAHVLHDPYPFLQVEQDAKKRLVQIKPREAYILGTSEKGVIVAFNSVRK